MENAQAAKSSPQKFSIKHLLARIFQVKANKPRSVKVIQWILLLMGMVSFYFFWLMYTENTLHPDYIFLFLTCFNAIFFLTYFLSFFLLYTYRRWGLISLRVIGLIPFFLVSTGIIFSFFYLIPAFFGVRSWYFVGDIDPITNVRYSEYLEWQSNYIPVASIVLTAIYLLPALLFIFFWVQLHEYDKRDKKSTS